MIPPPNKCLCGCGEFTELNGKGGRNKYVKGHHYEAAQKQAVNYEALSINERIAGVEEWVQKRDTVSPATLSSLAARFHLSPKEARVVIDRARLKLAANAERYVQAHMETVEAALEIGTESALNVAQKGAEWAMERIGTGNSRVIDSPKVGGGTGGPQIVIGISVGGIKPQAPVIEAGHDEAPRVMITSGEVVESLSIPDVRSFPKPPQPKHEKPLTPKAKKRLHNEKKIQKLLSLVTPDTAQLVTRSIIELGTSPAFAWEMVKEMLEVDERVGRS